MAHPHVHAADSRLRDAIEVETAAILSSAEFTASPRSSEFLAYAVGCMLDCRPDLLKERTIGVAVLGREASYDTGSDAAVRVRASDVRRRLARYYANHVPKRGWGIALPPGSYAPKWVPESADVRLTYMPGARPSLLIEAGDADGIRRVLEMLRDEDVLQRLIESERKTVIGVL